MGEAGVSVRRRSRGVLAASLLLATSPLHAQVQGDQDVTGPYEVVEGWLEPMPWHEEGWTFGLTAAVYPETTERIFLLRGEIFRFRGLRGGRAPGRMRITSRATSSSSSTGEGISSSRGRSGTASSSAAQGHHESL